MAYVPRLPFALLISLTHLSSAAPLPSRAHLTHAVPVPSLFERHPFSVAFSPRVSLFNRLRGRDTRKSERVEHERHRWLSVLQTTHRVRRLQGLRLAPTPTHPPSLPLPSLSNSSLVDTTRVSLFLLLLLRNAMASTLPQEKKWKPTKTTAGAAPHRRGGGGGGSGLGDGGTGQMREDPHHTWNQQLMEACLACDAAVVRKLIECGADPVNAREVPPPSYYTGPIIQQLQRPSSSEAGWQSALPAIDQRREVSPLREQSSCNSSLPTPVAAAAPDSLPPLVAMLLSGLNTPAALEVMKLLIQHGASVNDTFSFSTTPLAAAGPGMDASEDERGGVAAGGTVANGSSGRGRRSRSVSADSKGKPPSGKSRASAIGAPPTVAPGAAAFAAVAGAGGAVVNPPEAPKHEERTVVGSVLHYVVAHCDHAQLMRLLLLATTAINFAADTSATLPSLPLHLQQQRTMDEAGGDGSPSLLQPSFPAPLPYSLLPAVEAETLVGAMRLLHQQHSGGAADAAGPNGSPSLAVTPGTSQPRKSRNASNAAALLRSTGTAAAAPPATAPPSAQAGGPMSAASLVSPSAAEAVLTALHQALLQRQTSTGGYRGLPILMSVYPQQQQKKEEGHADAADAAATDSAATAGVVSPAVAAAATPHNWWSLTSLCDVTGPVSADDLHQRTHLNLDLLDTCGRSAATIALERGDAVSVRLLSFFGAHVPFGGPVNASQTRLARACSNGDVARVEALLRQGDTITQLSADGRYTLVHYAAAQPSVLQVLGEHGLSMDFENSFGESALVSLLRHGTARNDPRYVQTLLALAAAVRSASTDGAMNTATTNLVNSMSSTTSANAVHFAQLSGAMQRNMILCPPVPLAALTSAGGATSGAAAAHLRVVSNSMSHGSAAQSANTNSGGSNVACQPFLGGCEVGTWWSFLPQTATTADVLDTLLRAGAVVQGFVPDEELDLPYVLFAEWQASIGAGGGGGGGSASTANGDDEAEDDGAGDGGMDGSGDAHGEDDYRSDDEDSSGADAGSNKVSRRSLSVSAATVTPASVRRDCSKRRQQRLAPVPARLPMRLTPLQHAIFDYHPELIRRLLVDYRVDPMHRDSQGATAVHYAVLCTHAQSVLELLLSPQVLVSSSIGNNKGRLSNNTGPDAFTAAATALPATHIDLNAIDMAGRTPLFYAAYVGNTTAVQRLIRFGGATLLCGKADKDGYTPLHIAVRQRHADIVELLVRHSNQLLGSAAGGGRGQPRDIFAELLASTNGGGGSTGRSLRGGTRRGSHLSPTTSSHGAGGSSSADPAGIAKLELLVNVEAEESATHMTALEMAIKAWQPTSLAPLSEAEELQKGQLLRIASVLLAEAQASPLRPSGLANGGALLHRAVADGAVEMAELLLSHYADPNEANDVNETPLFLALRLAAPRVSSAEQAQQHRHRRTSLVRVLLQYGATPYAQSSANLQTPMHLAASSLGDADEILQLLFYSTPEAGGSSVAARRRRHEQQRHHRAPSNAANGTDGTSRGESYSLGGGGGGMEGSSSARRRHSGSGVGSIAGRKGLLERRAQQRRASPSSSLPGRAANASPASRRKQWRAAALSDNEHSEGLADLDGLADDQASLANSSFGYRDARNSSVTSVEQGNSDQSLRGTVGVLAPATRGGADEDVPQEEYEQFLQRLAQWQCADHLLEPEKCWLLTDAQGQTPLHVLCSRSSRALQYSPAVVKLLDDLQAVTRTNSVITAAAAGVFDGVLDDDHVLALCWRLPDAHGRTPLHIAAQSGFVEAIERILQQAPRSALAVDMQGRTPLHACVLMASSTTTPTAVTAGASGDDDDDVGDDHITQHKASKEDVAERATQLRHTLSLLRGVITADNNAAAGATKLPLQLQGAPLRRAAGDIMPSLSMKTTTTRCTTGGNAAASHSSAQRVVASLVQPSSITAQLQRWQQSRHWGCPALAMKGIGTGMSTASRDGSAAAAAPASRYLQSSGGASTLSSATSEWKAYAQLPDGQGRTALLLAAEVGNVSAARELLKIL
ncbi:Ankyrin repeats protein [Leishmania braziliensis]|nr:Ankyrin repeats protein [Leishmania braziliensis]